MRRTLLVGLTWLLLCAPAFAQTLGTITGEVKDSTGAVVPGVTVTVVNKATNATRTTQSNAVGLFDFPALPPGTYTREERARGFQDRDARPRTAGPADGARQLHARVGHHLRNGDRDRRLAAGRNHATRPSAPSSRTGASSSCRSTAGTICSSSRSSPNVSAEFAGAGQAGDRQGGTRANQQLSISGQRREFNYYTLDGVDNTDVNFNTYIFLPSVDALEEFKVQTGVYSAEFGREASQVNVVTKSGTNSLHGTVFEFHRDDAFDARPYAFTAAQAAAPKAPFKWDQYGYTAGGPVWKNHLFFMSNFEGYKDRQAVPDALQRAVGGDAGRQLLGAARPAWARSIRRPGQPAGVIVDPTQCTVVGTTRTCQPFAGNIIPAGRLDATSKQLLEFYPEPNNGTGAPHQQLPVVPGSRDRQEPVHAADGFRAELALRPGWAATATARRASCRRR